jgi:hypothetical protein
MLHLQTAALVISAGKQYSSNSWQVTTAHEWHVVVIMLSAIQLLAVPPHCLLTQKDAITNFYLQQHLWHGLPNGGVETADDAFYGQLMSSSEDVIENDL